MMDDLQLIDAYLADMAFRNLLPGTRHVRSRYLLKLSREIGFADATEQKLIRWLSRDISAKTRGMWISTINSFYTFCLKADDGKPAFPPNEDKTPFNPVANISKPKQHPRQPRPIPKDDLRLALEHADTEMKCWLLFAALSGCRCQEIAGIEREDIYEDTMRLQIRKGKGDKERWTPLHAEILKALHEYKMPTTGPLWKETPASVSRKGNRFLHGLGIKSTMHTLRHYFGTEVYRSSKDLRLTQELMGHSSPQTTAGYAAADQSQAAGVVGTLNI